MDANSISTYIANFGFPIVMCLILAWYIYSEQGKMRNVIENNTAALKELIIHMRNDRKED